MTTTQTAIQIDDQTNRQTNTDHDAIKPLLNQVRIVMVNTTLPANIGSAARAMWTMGLSDLMVVKPKLPIDDSSVAHAAGAQDILNNCQIVDTLAHAIGDCQLVFAASSRQRHIPRPVVTPSQAARIIMERSDSIQHVAVLFGREDRGLTNDELAVADYHIQINANPAYPVLNVASAVQVIASFFYNEFLSGQNTASTQNVIFDEQQPNVQLMLRQVWDTPAITQAQKLNLQTRIIELMHTLSLLDSIDPEQLRDLPNRLSRLLSRLQLDEKEFEIISAIIAKVKLKL